jgi:hypothetical protein
MFKLCYGLYMNDVHGMEIQMFAQISTRMRGLIRQINTASAEEVEGLVLLGRIDDEVAGMTAAIAQVEGRVEPALLVVAKARLHALKEAAIAARALRPEHIRFSGALACLRQGAVMGPVMGQAAMQLMARVA